MKVQILTEIDVDPDGLHCGGKCKLRYVHCVTCRSVCLLDGKELSDANDRVHYIRNAACLAAQKAAEGMTEWPEYPQNIPEHEKEYVVILKNKEFLIESIGRATYLSDKKTWLFTPDESLPYFRPIQPGDRFWPQAQEANDAD